MASPSSGPSGSQSMQTVALPEGQDSGGTAGVSCTHQDTACAIKDLRDSWGGQTGEAISPDLTR